MGALSRAEALAAYTSAMTPFSNVGDRRFGTREELLSTRRARLLAARAALEAVIDIKPDARLIHCLAEIDGELGDMLGGSRFTFPAPMETRGLDD